MRKERLKIKGQRAMYHVMSRTVNGEIFFSEEEKEVMRRMLFKVAGFCGVKVLTYCLMGNH
ncbi:MAG: transposase, partial [Opitutales bacterium]|nr:transposase [Opitutales bacterium]